MTFTQTWIFKPEATGLPGPGDGNERDKFTQWKVPETAEQTVTVRRTRCPGSPTQLCGCTLVFSITEESEIGIRRTLPLYLGAVMGERGTRDPTLASFNETYLLIISFQALLPCPILRTSFKMLQNPLTR